MSSAGLTCVGWISPEASPIGTRSFDCERDIHMSFVKQFVVILSRSIEKIEAANRVASRFCSPHKIMTSTWLWGAFQERLGKHVNRNAVHTWARKELLWSLLHRHDHTESLCLRFRCAWKDCAQTFVRGCSCQDWLRSSQEILFFLISGVHQKMQCFWFWSRDHPRSCKAHVDVILARLSALLQAERMILTSSMAPSRLPQKTSEMIAKSQDGFASGHNKNDC